MLDIPLVDGTTYALNHLPYAVAIFDQDLHFLSTNQQWLKDYALVDKPILGKSVYEVFPETPEVWRDLYQRALNGETILSADERFQTPKGDILFLSWKIYPWYKAEQAAPAGVVLVTEDNTADMATAIKRETLLIKAAEDRRWRAEFTAQINALLAQATTEQEILNAVAQFAQKYEVMISSLNYFHYDDNTHPMISEVMALQLGDGSPLPVEIIPQRIYPTRDYPIMLNVINYPERLSIIEDSQGAEVDEGTRAAMEAVQIKSLIQMPLKIGGQLQGALVFTWGQPRKFAPELLEIMRAIIPTVASVVASRRLYLRTVKTNERLLELDRLKNEFISMMSHELRTPLNAIIGLSDVILSGLNGPISDRVERDVRTVFNAGQQLLGIVNDVLDIAKIESGTLQLNRREARLNEIVNASFETLQPSAAAKGLNLQVALPADLPAVRVDKSRIQQVVNNLLMNAVKFTEKGSIQVSGQVQDGKVVVCVQDEGIGIDPLHHEIIFQHFRQVEGALNRRNGGIGLGLPISRRLIEMHEGQLWVESQLNTGARFYFSLPIYRTEA
jgi:signal transduction histidine kinase